MDKKSKIYVAGHRGMVGSALVKSLRLHGYENIIVRSHSELDLTNESDVERFFSTEKPEYVFLAAAKVGGIKANSEYPADFININLKIGLNVVNSSYSTGVKKLLNLGSSCIYPKMANQPLKESALLSGYLEPTNEAYAVAKIAVIELCKFYNLQYGTNYISAMPTNLYGPGDNYDLETSHVLPAMIRKFHEAKVKKEDITLWGDGSPYREFLYSEDLAEACIYLMQNYNYSEIGDLINIGCGEDLKIKELAELVATIVGYEGNIYWDDSVPNGTPKKLLDISRIVNLGWSPKIGLQEGISLAYNDFLRNNL